MAECTPEEAKTEKPQEEATQEGKSKSMGKRPFSK